VNGGGMGRGGILARGGVEITHQNDDTRRKISIRTAHSWAKSANLITLALIGFAWLWWWFVLIMLYEPAPKLSPLSSWWGCVVFVLGTWGRVMGRSWPLWLIPLPLQWLKPLWTLNKKNLEPKVKNDHWPPESAQMDPNTSGFVTAENWDARAGVGVAQPTTVIPEIDLNAMIKNGQNETRTRVRMPVSQVRRWRSFCCAYTHGDCRFSGNAAEGFGVDRALFDRVVDKWASPDPQMALIDPASVGPRKTLEPTDKGEGMIAVFASTPLDELSALLAPYETDRQ